MTRVAEFAVGDLVVCSSREFREQLRLDTEVGLYLGGRRRDGLVHLARAGRSVWIPHRALIHAQPDDSRVMPPAPWLLRVHEIMRILAATDIELEREEDGSLRARIGGPGFNLEQLAAVVDKVGGAGHGLRIVPGSMSRVVVSFPVPDAESVRTQSS